MDSETFMQSMESETFIHSVSSHLVHTFQIFTVYHKVNSELEMNGVRKWI